MKTHKMVTLPQDVATLAYDDQGIGNARSYIANRATMFLLLLHQQPPVDENLAIWSASL